MLPKIKINHVIASALIGVCVMLGGIQQAYAAEFNLRAVSNANESDEDYDGLIVFKDYVESHSNGKIGVDIYMGTQLCSNGVECLEALESGSIDIYISTSGGAASMFPYIQVLDLPYILPNDRVAETVFRTGDFTRALRQQILKDSGNSVRLMTIGNTGGWRNFANTKHTVKTPADLKGMKIRTIVADLPQQLVRAMGASPTPIPWGDLFTSLQTGVVDGSKNGITDIMGMKFTDAGLKYLTLDGHAYMSALWFMNNDVFEKMPKDLRKVVVDGFYNLQQATFASPKRKSIQAYKDFKKAGGEVYVPTPAEKAQFKEAAKPVYAWFEKNVKNGDKWYNLLNNAAIKAEKQVNADDAKDLK
ncbi:TRAP transporter substrate-binding protein DctP [Marinomonas spartinae]|uniref:TRAP transporter substrate-binding protein n=1 Tax=Marinomonas spartinae TaxID=1792290 RepID=UPI0018F2099B|nr:TRAP transporter substrate-binding protein DctP [Marinomonas spartinae]MBJ7555519.1 TRAP transporter substrate-binding protein DctP [Marinomonas spartinae]